MEEKPNYYAIIPADVRYDPELSSSEKLLYGEISALTNKTGECWASNNYFASLYDKTPEHISVMINHLKKNNHIETELIYKDKQIEKRIISIKKNLNTGIKKNLDTPLKKNLKENNINYEYIIKEYEKEIGLLTPYQYQILESYFNDLSEEMIIEAIHRASKMNKKNLSYIEGILKNWINNGYKVLGDIKENKNKKEIEKLNTSMDLNSLYEN